MDPAKHRYIGLKFQHSADAAVDCGVTAAADSLYLPAGNSWSLVV